jgi:hypothetical protein
MLDDVEFEVTKLALGPDDMLAVRPTKSISSVVASELRAQLERRLNLSGRVVMLDAGLETRGHNEGGREARGRQIEPDACLHVCDDGG